jgi:hypothetical protein
VTVRPVARWVLTFAVGRAVFGAVFLVSMLGHWVTAWYLPLERRWVIASSVNTLGMDWYGRSAMSLAAGLAAGAAAWALGGWSRVAPKLGEPSVVLGVTRIGATMLLFDVLFYTLSLLTRDIDPQPPPSWYCPR